MERCGDRELEAEMKRVSITLNGKEKRIEPGRSVAKLLADLDLHPRMVVVEHNREILDRDRFEEIEVRDGDVLELVHFVGGG